MANFISFSASGTAVMAAKLNTAGGVEQTGYIRSSEFGSGGGGGITAYKLVIPSRDAAVLGTTPFLLEGLKGSFVIAGGVIYLSGEATNPITNISAFSIFDDTISNIYYKSANISTLDPGNIVFVSAAGGGSNVAVSPSGYYIKTNTDSTLQPGGDLIVVLYLIDYSSELT